MYSKIVTNLPREICNFSMFLADGLFRKDALLNFIKTNKLPLVSTFSKDTATEIFDSPIKQQVSPIQYIILEW